MKQLAMAGILALGMMAGGCGTTTNTEASAVNGTWQAAITLGDGAATQYDFITSFSAPSSGTGSLGVGYFSFNTAGSCFMTGTSASGTFTLTSDVNSVISGSFTFAVQSGSPAGNTLSLTGTQTGNTITGTWTLTGSSACTGAGNFTMTQTT
jgi:hypothetical protein